MELELFRHARRWKAGWSHHPAPRARGRTLDVGAGIGANVVSLANKAPLRGAFPAAGRNRPRNRMMIPVSRVVGPLPGYCFGTTMIAVFSRA